MALFFFASVASAQYSVDVHVGVGYAWDKTNNQGIDNANSPTNAFGACTPGSGDTYCETTPALNSVFMGIGGDVMFKKQFGFGADIDLMPKKNDYGPFQFRQTFYDFNGIWAPLRTKRAVLHIEGGIGAAKTGFSYTQSGCVGTSICSTSSSPVASESHFDVHVGAGVMLFVTNHIFILPQIDLHYAPGLDNQFSSNLAPAAMVSVGYSSGDH
ncbi:MAG: outer membrane beta-barrel protein [Terriglobales bacterium]